MSEAARFQAQVFLLGYPSRNYLLGTTSPGDPIEHLDDLTFPDGYLAHGSPEQLGRTMATLLRAGKGFEHCAKTGERRNDYAGTYGCTNGTPEA
jgi:hypothetical protein